MTITITDSHGVELVRMEVSERYTHREDIVFSYAKRAVQEAMIKAQLLAKSQTR